MLVGGMMMRLLLPPVYSASDIVKTLPIENLISLSPVTKGSIYGKEKSFTFFFCYLLPV